MRLRHIFLLFVALTPCPVSLATQPNVYEIQTIGVAGTGCTPGVALACTDMSGTPNMYNIYVDGYLQQGDGGGGYFYSTGSTNCNANGGTIVLDGHSTNGHCFYRANPTNDVREWGAYCDVVALGNTPAPDPPWGPILWNGSDSDGTKTGAIEIPAKYFNPSNSTAYALPQAGTGEFITATQIGPVIPAGTSNPPVWADRWSQVASSSASFSAGDLLSFAGPTTSGQFSQQIAISVDQIEDTSNNILPPGMSGKIHKWHFVWGGQYTSLPDATMTLDTSHSYVAHGITGASASFTPAWSAGAGNLLDLRPPGGGAYYPCGNRQSRGSTCCRVYLLPIRKAS